MFRKQYLPFVACLLLFTTGCGYDFQAPETKAPKKSLELGVKKSALSATCFVNNLPSYFGQHLVFDHFKNIPPVHNQPGGQYWWPHTFNGATRTDGYTAADGTAKIRLKQEGCRKYLRLSIFPSVTPGTISVADITDVRDPGNHAGQQLRWKASYRHPVILSTRLRWQGDFRADGTGAVGTSGVAIWSASYLSNAASPVNYMGLNWVMQGTALATPGFKANVTNNYVPLANFPPPAGTDFTKWNTFKLIWSVNQQGQESIRFYLNGKKWGTTVQLQTPLPPTGLGLDLWNDNQRFTLQGATYVSPPQAQHIDFDYIKVIQP